MTETNEKPEKIRFQAKMSVKMAVYLNKRKTQKQIILKLEE